MGALLGLRVGQALQLGAEDDARELRARVLQREVQVPARVGLRPRDLGAALINLENGVAVSRLDERPDAMRLPVRQVELDSRFGASGFQLNRKAGAKIS